MTFLMEVLMLDGPMRMLDALLQHIGACESFASFFAKFQPSGACESVAAQMEPFVAFVFFFCIFVHLGGRSSYG